MKSSSLWKDMAGIAALMGPILITQYAQIANGVVDTLMCGRLDAQALGAVGLGVAVWVPMQAFLIGILYGLLVELAQLCGAGKESEVSFTTQQAAWLGVVLAGVMGVLIYFASAQLTVLGLPQELVPMVEKYLRGLAWGFPFCGLFYSLRFYCEGQGAPKAVTAISIGAVGCNILLNYGLMFGGFGLPALGLQGCGIATGLCWVLTFVAAAVYVSVASRFAGSRLFKTMFAPAITSVVQLFRVGLPIGIAFLSEYLVMACIALMIGRLGTVAVASHQITYNFSLVLFTLPVALSIAISIVVGQARGAQDTALERRMVSTGMLMSTVIGVFLTVLLLFMATWIPTLYTNDPDVLHLAGALLTIAAFFQLTDSIQIGLSGALRGIHDTTVPLILTAASYWGVGIPLGYILSEGTEFTAGILPQMGVQGWWIGLIVSISLAGMLLFVRVRRSFWGAEVVAQVETETLAEESV
ncbi:MATE family efflux transporter [Maridesulfovibrio sp.]|uniref:MATE family efflux transporter n=1 Tax=Maridesulfovibrio sp. TaxID=2795000 RepID=UPI003BAA0132